MTVSSRGSAIIGSGLANGDKQRYQFQFSGQFVVQLIIERMHGSSGSAEVPSGAQDFTVLQELRDAGYASYDVVKLLGDAENGWLLFAGATVHARYAADG